MTTIVARIYDWLSAIGAHLWLSVSSINFYQRVILNYSGYGIKYVLTLSFFSAIICSMLMLSYFDNLKQYFTYGTGRETLINLDHVLPSVASLDHIISQIPELKYDGESISLDDPGPIYINGINNQMIAAIDPENKLSSSERAKVSFLLAKKKIIISFKDTGGSSINNISLEYSRIFGKESQIITQEAIRSLIENLLSKIPAILIYVTFPVLVLLIFVNVLLEKSFIIVAVYLLTTFLSTKSSIKTCIRLAMFSSGISVFLQLPTLFIAPNYSLLVWLAQIWSNFLMIVSIIKISNQNFFRLKK